MFTSPGMFMRRFPQVQPCKVEERRAGWAGVGAFPHSFDTVDARQTGVGMRTGMRAGDEGVL